MNPRLTPRVELNGSPLDAEGIRDLVELRVSLEVGLPARVELRFADVDFSRASSTTLSIGTALKVAAADGSVVVEAEVTSLAVEASDGQPPELVAVAHDRAHRLGRAPAVRTFQNQTIAAIVRQIAGQAGLSAEVKGGTDRVEYLLQAESDLVVLDSLARRCGCDWWVRGTKLHFAPPTTTGTPVRLGPPQLISLSVRATGSRPSEVVVDGWDAARQEAVRATVRADSAPNAARAKGAFVDRVLTDGKKAGPASIRTSALAADSSAEANTLASALAARSVAAAVAVRGSAVNHPDGFVDVLTLAIGTPLQVEEMGPVSGTYHLTAVEHVYRPGTGCRTRFSAGERSPSDLVDLLGGRDEMAGPFRHTGLVVGQVTNSNDPERRGRVRVRFEGLDAQNESGWARVVTLGGGNKRGIVFVPEVGDEVLVGFEEGDLRHPVVLGGLFGQKSAISAWDVGSNGTVIGRHITSRLGHVIEMRDGTSPGDQLVRIALEGKSHEFVLGKERVDLKVPGGVPVTITAGTTKIAIAKNGDLSAEAPNIKLKAQVGIVLEATTIELKAHAKAAITSGGPLEAKGAIVQVEGQGPVAIKGAMVAIN